MQALIGTIYDAATEPALWNGAIAELVRKTGARSGIFYDHHDATRQSRVLGAEGFDPYYVNRYEQYYGALDPWHRCGRTRMVGSIDQTAGMLSAAELRRTEFYQDHLRPQGVFYAMGGPVERASGRMAIFGIQCGYENGPFTPEAQAIVTALMPHFRRAYGMQQTLAGIFRQVAEFEAALHVLGQPVLVVDCDAFLWFANAAGEELLRRGDVLSRSRGRLHVAHRDDAAAFAQALAPVPRRSDGDGTMMLRRAGGATPCRIRIMPLRSGNRAEWSGRIALLVEARPSRRGTRALALAFRLSAAELRLWEELMAGRTLSAIAERSHVSIHTVRVQLAGLFRKTGANRQADLVRLGLDLAGQGRN